mmetsp:Transcript_74935/g.201024  ORF Transcript_74935/g.201024 Transcript_74935/m.201024 type:complete len:222 (-) Transcript_74935:69-734(-)
MATSTAQLSGGRRAHQCHQGWRLWQHGGGSAHLDGCDASGGDVLYGERGDGQGAHGGPEASDGPDEDSWGIQVLRTCRAAEQEDGAQVAALLRKRLCHLAPLQHSLPGIRLRRHVRPRRILRRPRLVWTGPLALQPAHRRAARSAPALAPGRDGGRRRGGGDGGAAREGVALEQVALGCVGRLEWRAVERRAEYAQEPGSESQHENQGQGVQALKGNLMTV